MSEFNIKYEPKSITGLLVAAGIAFVGTGAMTGNAEVTGYGNLFLLLGLGSWAYHIDKHNKKSVNNKLVRRPRR